MVQSAKPRIGVVKLVLIIEKKEKEKEKKTKLHKLLRSELK